MSIQVYVSVVLRDHCGGRDTFVVDGACVQDVVEAIDREYPGFGDHVLGPDGSFRGDVRVVLNGQGVATADGAKVSLDPDDEVYFLYPIAGG